MNLKQKAKDLLLVLPALPARWVVNTARRIKYANKTQPQEWLNTPNKPVFKRISTNSGEFDILLDPYSNGYVDYSILQDGFWDKSTMEIICKLYSSDAKNLFVDIGANIGFFSLYAAAIGYDVVAFEPVKSLAQQFSKSIEKNNLQDKITLHNYACSDIQTESWIYHDRANMGGSSIIKNSKTSKTKRTREKIKLVPAETFLNLDNIHEYKNILIKIDTEGYEHESLKGMENFIISFEPVIVFEYSPLFYGSLDKSLRIIDFLQKHGYKIMILPEYENSSSPKHQLVEIKDSVKLTKKLFIFSRQKDILAVPNSKSAEILKKLS